VRRTAGLVLVGVALTVLAGCGSGSSGKQPAAASSSGANGFAAYTTCLSQNGVKLPSFARPTERPSGAPRPSRSPGSDAGRGFGGSGFGGGGFGGGGFLGDENNPPTGVDAATWKAALAACASKRPSFTGGGNQNNSRFTAYRNCLQDHGVTLSQGTQLSTTDPKVAAALKTCAPLRPTPNRSAPPSPNS
jgi:hypothetical protein